MSFAQFLPAKTRKTILAKLETCRRSARNQGLKQALEKETAEEFLQTLAVDLSRRLGFASSIKVVSCELIVKDDSEADVTFEGETKSWHVPGLVCLCGEFMADGRRVKLFPKFVSHPFWQCGRF